MQACIDWFPAIFGDGVWMALGGAHYHYIREIPINTPYEIRMSIGGWEDKWVSLSRFLKSLDVLIKLVG